MTEEEKPTVCGYCKDKSDDLILRPDLMDPRGIHPDRHIGNWCCEHCVRILENKSLYNFVCQECGEDNNGLLVIHDSFGTFCLKCYESEGWVKPTLTPIPPNGWTQSDIGRQVYIRGEHGVIIPDIIICSALPHGKTMIGPGYVIGGVMARMRHMQEESQETATIRDGMETIRKFFEDDFDDEEGGLIP